MGCCFSDEGDLAYMSAKKKYLGAPLLKDRDVLPYEEGQDNARAYRGHEELRDTHDNFLHKQASKNVHAVLADQRRRTMSKDIRQDIHIRAGVLPAPTEEREIELDKISRGRARSGTDAQRRAAQERLALEPALKQKRKKSQLIKMSNNMAYQTPAGKRAIELALAEHDEY